MSRDMSSATTSRMPNSQHRLPAAALRALTVIALLVDAVIHFQLASNYQLAAPAGLGQGNLFRLEAVVAIIAAAWVMLRGSWLGYAAALGVAAGGLAAVLVYRYVQVPAFGPIPSMYEPLWFTRRP